MVGRLPGTTEIVTTDSRHQTPPVLLSMADVLTRLTSENTKTWGSLSTSQLQLVRLARRTLYELRLAVATRQLRS